ncbi:MAG: SEC-C metal-binding domain-containing protein [Planctomycetota bacterium]|jgi:hypothetical protein
MSEFDTRIESWAAEFAESPEAGPYKAEVRHASQNMLAEFLGGACEDGCDPTQIDEAEVRKGLLERVAGLPLDGELRKLAPGIVAAYLEMLGRHGRVAKARHLASFTRALDKAFHSAGAAHKGTPEVREAPKLGRNDPCPCGSGKKWKKCCRNELPSG